MTAIAQASFVAVPWSLTSIVKAAGLEHLARRIEGDNFFVCDLTLHGVQGCADMRDAILQQQFVAELVAIGACLFVAVLVGSLATTFVHLFARGIAPMRGRRVLPVSAAAKDDRLQTAVAA